MCLKAYKMDVATVINVVLENMLLPALNEVDFTLSEIPSDILKVIISSLLLIRNPFLRK